MTGRPAHGKSTLGKRRECDCCFDTLLFRRSPYMSLTRLAARLLPLSRGDSRDNRVVKRCRFRAEKRQPFAKEDRHECHPTPTRSLLAARSADDRASACPRRMAAGSRERPTRTGLPNSSTPHDKVNCGGSWQHGGQSRSEHLSVPTGRQTRDPRLSGARRFGRTRRVQFFLE